MGGVIHRHSQRISEKSQGLFIEYLKPAKSTQTDRSQNLGLEISADPRKVPKAVVL
jgi:hypothetical protein